MRLYRLGEVAEQGLVANLVVKDHSRLGRNRLVVGQLLEEDFVRLNVRYIAIMDNIDIARGVSDIVFNSPPSGRRRVKLLLCTTV